MDHAVLGSHKKGRVVATKMRPVKGLDFVVGGIPRSGTTAFADALNRHPDVFCYASETGLLPLAQQIGGHARIPPGSIPMVRSFLREALFSAMVEMVEFNMALGSPEPTVRFQKSEIDHFISEMLHGLGPRGHNETLTEIASVTLARELRQRSGKTFVGEKTPANIFALDVNGDARFDAKGAAPVFVVVRRPLPAILSMRARFTNKADVFASAFSGDAAQQAGLYLRYAFACARLARRGAHLLRYEAFSGNARGIMPKVLSAIGVSWDNRSIGAINRQIDYRTRQDVRDKFSSADQATIDALTETALIPLGYGRDPRSRSAEAEFDLGYRVLSGEYEDKMLGRRSVVLLVAQAHHQCANLRFWHSFPGSVADGSDTVCWWVDAVDGCRLGSITAFGGGPTVVDLSIDLNPIQGMPCANGNVMHVVEVECSHAFVPLVHPFRLQPCSHDLREISGQILSVDFS